MTISSEKLNRILKASNLLNSTKDVDYILNFLLQECIDLIPGGDTGVIFLFNESKQLLEPKVAVGFNDSIHEVNLKPGESMTGAAFVLKKTLFLDTPDLIAQYMSTIRMQNLSNILPVDDIGLGALQGSICCPLISKDDCIGVVVIDNFKGKDQLVNADVPVLEAISVQATIAIINARNHENEKFQRKALERSNLLLEEERNKYEFATNIHNQFTDMVLKGNSISGIINAASEILQRPIYHFDVFCNIQHQSKDSYMLALKSERIQKSLLFRPYYHTLTIDDTFLHAFPIMVNGDLLGWICVHATSPRLSEINFIAMEKATTTIALEILKNYELIDMEQSIKGDFFDGLISNQKSEYISKSAQEYNFDFEKSHRIGIIDFKQQLLTKDRKRLFKRIMTYAYRSFNTALLENFPGSVSVIRRNRIILILETSPINQRYQLIDFLESSLAVLRQSVLKHTAADEIRIGISDIITHTTGFKKAFDQAEYALNLTTSIRKEKPYLFFEDLEVKSLLIQNERSTLDTFLERVLGALIQYDRKSKGDFLETLRVYIRSNGNWTYTKDQLHIHGNSLNYRLGRISEILKLSLQDYYDRLKIQLALEIMDLQKD